MPRRQKLIHVRRRRAVRDPPRVPLLLRARDDVQDEPRLRERGALPVRLQRPPGRLPLGLLELRHDRARAVLFEDTNYATWLLNTFLVGAAVVGITLLLAMPAGYARLAGGWGQSAGVAIFLVYLIPPTLLFLPLSRLITQLDLKDSLWSLILVYPSFTVPFATWLLMGFFKTIRGARGGGADGRCLAPEGAVPDRASHLLPDPDGRDLRLLAVRERVHLRVHVHLELRAAHRLCGVPNDLIRGDVFFWQSLMAAALIPAIPLALLYNAFLDRFIKGFTGGAFR